MRERYTGSELDLFETAWHWKAYLRDMVSRWVRQGSVLEIGAGTGGTTQWLISLPHARWTCLEPDEVLAARIVSRFSNLPPERRPEVVVGTLEDMPKAPVFHSILYIDVLEHIRNDEVELRQAVSRLAIGGTLVVVAPAHAWLFTRFDAVIGHYRRYCRNDLARMLLPAALRLQEARYLDCVGLMASLANRLLLKQGQPSPGMVSFWDRVMIPLSRRLDPWFGYRIGKSILAVWTRSE